MSEVVPLQTIFVAGFPAIQNDLDLNSGQIRSIREDVLINPEQAEGYALVYSNQTLPGTSGGAVIDENGLLVAINGETERDPTTGRDISRGIPINIFLSAMEELVLGNEIAAAEAEENRRILEEKLFGNSTNSLSLDETAENITVKVIGHSNGSGVIFLQEENIYSVVTNKHVTPVETNYKIRTNDGVEHKVISRQEIPDLDLAIIQFNSSESYYTASLGDSSELKRLQPIYVAGFPGELTDLSINSGEITTIRQDIIQTPSLEKGYALNYSNNVFPGTSGGAILDQNGIVVGINAEANIEHLTGRTISRGIPINFFIDSWIELNLKSD